jgi:hypothetical protein
VAIINIIFVSIIYNSTYIFFQKGNAGETCWESKLCDPVVASNINSFIKDWQPDVILFAEMYNEVIEIILS